MAKKADKVIVTNLSALRAKYGSELKRISEAVAALIKADAARGLTSRMVALDDAKAMKSLNAKPVVKATNRQQNKIAIDGLFAALRPDYLLILGAIDVVPHQDLRNPLYSPGDDDDRFAFGDLPYACEAPYSHDIGDFRGPTRVVGRLPDLTGGTDASYLVGLLRIAASSKTRARADYDDHLGVSALVWKKSTELSLKETFGSATDLQTSPPKGPSWTKAQLARRSHFINCHGASGEPFFYGQSGQSFPEAVSAAKLPKQISDGTVVAAECCYGGELYDPEGGQMGICSTYLASGAYAVFGSSTIAYGPAEGNGSADLICQYFLQQILAGASLGRAALEARQQFVERVTLLDPADLKTLGQFSLLGDPSIHPVVGAKSALSRTKVYQAALGAEPGMPAGRGLRRERLLRRGIALPRIVGTVRKQAKTAPPKIKTMLTTAARESGLKTVSFTAFAQRAMANGMPKGSKAIAGGRTDVYVAIGNTSGDGRATKKGPNARSKSDASRSKIVRPVVLSAIVKDGEVVRFRRLHGK